MAKPIILVATGELNHEEEIAMERLSITSKQETCKKAELLARVRISSSLLQ